MKPSDGPKRVVWSPRVTSKDSETLNAPILDSWRRKRALAKAPEPSISGTEAALIASTIGLRLLET
jgi:hypothetical protein